MKQIPLYIGRNKKPCGEYALIDDGDYDLVSGIRWRVYKSFSGTLYAICSLNGKAIPMHRLITNAPYGMDVDHLDGDGLNNQRYNMEVVTSSVHGHRKTDRSKPKYGYHGVGQNKSSYYAVIVFNNKTMIRSRFATPEEAARAYDDMAYQCHGKHARLNFPT